MARMGARKALMTALTVLQSSHYEGSQEAFRVIEMMLEQGGCGEIPPGESPLTDAIDMAVFG